MFILTQKTCKKGEKIKKILKKRYLKNLLCTYNSRTQYLSYDMRDLIGAVGGYFGLFLGWSFLSIFAWCLETVCSLFNKHIKSSQKLLN